MLVLIFPTRDKEKGCHPAKGQPPSSKHEYLFRPVPHGTEILIKLISFILYVGSLA